MIPPSPTPTAAAPFRGHRFQVPQPDGSIAIVHLLVDSDGFLRKILKPEGLADLIEAGGNRPRLDTPLPGAPVPGITLQHNPDGSVTPLLDETTKRNHQLFVKEIPCWFPECEALRKAWLEEVAEMKRKDPKCPGCKLGTLQRKYLTKMAKLDTLGPFT